MYICVWARICAYMYLYMYTMVYTCNTYARSVINILQYILCAYLQPCVILQHYIHTYIHIYIHMWYCCICVYCVWSYSTSTTSTIGNHRLGVWRKALAAPVSHRHIFDFSRMRSKGSRFTLGVWGLRVCPIVRNRLQPSATVRNCPQPFAWGPYGRAYGKFCRMGHFWRFQTSRCFVSRGSRGTSWHSDMFCNVSKVVLCGKRNTFATFSFSQDKLQFSWQAQHFGRVHRHFAWQVQHFRRVVLRVFCESHGQGCVKWQQGANSLAAKLTEGLHETSFLR